LIKAKEREPPQKSQHDRDEPISKRDFARVCQLIYQTSGINLGEEKRTMVELRIRRRVKILNLDSFRNYCEYLFTPKGQRDEIIHLIDVISTNKTDFFREPEHFDFLIQKAIPDLIARTVSARTLLIWSAGCSTGEEPYTLAMVLQDFSQSTSGFRFKILATDISTQVLAKASQGVFQHEVLRPVPAEWQRKYFMKSRDPDSKLLRVVPELRQLIDFRRINFMDEDFGLAEKADVIFCRNVIIYFDRPTQQQIIGKLARNLLPGGYFFVGHSESLHDMDLPLVSIAPALYRKDDARA
jgi:chemotaxis protein methyltransferase CheR